MAIRRFSYWTSSRETATVGGEWTCGRTRVVLVVVDVDTGTGTAEFVTVVYVVVEGGMIVVEPG